MFKEIETFQEREVTCPYCKRIFEDSWERSGDNGEEDCDDCNKKFYWNRNIKVTYSSKGLCKENNVEHNWENLQFTRDNGTECKGRKCLTCNEYEFEK